MNKSFSDRVIIIIIAVFAIILFLPFLGGFNLFEGFEMLYAESAREMVETNNYLDIQLNYMPIIGASPLFIWLQAISMKIFGVNEFAARFPNAICGILTLILLYIIGKRLLNKAFGIIWVLFFCSSFLPMFYFRTGSATPWYSLFLFLSIYFAFEFFIATQKKQKYKYLISGSITLGLGAITKGIPIIFLFGLIVFIYLSIKMFKTKIKFTHILWLLVISSLFIGLWLTVQLVLGKVGNVSGFLKYQFIHIIDLAKGKNGFFMFHLFVIFLGVFPASIFAINIFKRQLKDDKEPLYEFKNWMIISFWTVLVLFTLIRNNIVQYSSLCYFSLTFLASYAVYKILYIELPLSRWIRRLLSITAFFIGFAVIILYLLSHNVDYLISSGLIKDQFVLGNLQAVERWPIIELFIGLIYIILILSFYTLPKLPVHVKIFGTLAATIVFNYMVLITLLPKYEYYRQGAAIEFYKEKSKEDCYVRSIGISGYADIFYTGIPGNNKKSIERPWLLKGDIDKPVYFVTRNIQASKIHERFPYLRIINEKNGYVFLKREINND